MNTQVQLIITTVNRVKIQIESKSKNFYHKISIPIGEIEYGTQHFVLTMLPVIASRWRCETPPIGEWSRWLPTNVLTPRLSLLASPYAFCSSQVDDVVTKNVISDSKSWSGGHIHHVRRHLVIKFAIGSSGGVAGYLTLQGIVRLSGIIRYRT